MAAVETNELEEFLADLEIDWFYSTKEQLSPADVFAGLLNHGLFAEKIPPCFNTQGLAECVSGKMSNMRMRPAKSSTQPRKAKTWCALEF